MICLNLGHGHLFSQRSVQPRIDQAPGMVSKKIASVAVNAKEEKSVAKPPQQEFQKKPEQPVRAKPPADPKAEIREIEPGIRISWEEADRRLREWDMNSRFGPCMSMTRLERWQRAEKLEMDPPASIYNVLKTFPELQDESLWHNRIHPAEPIIGV
jgi:DNA polymerase delta subunit 4